MRGGTCTYSGEFKHSRGECEHTGDGGYSKEASHQRTVVKGRASMGMPGSRRKDTGGPESSGKALCLCPQAAKRLALAWGAAAVLAYAVLYRNAMITSEFCFICPQGLSMHCTQGLSKLLQKKEVES